MIKLHWKALDSLLRKSDEKEKKRTRKAIAELFALNSNAIKLTMYPMQKNGLVKLEKLHWI